ncbi:aminotransferase class I and II [Desulfovibrio sp. X2]|uniref:pyridoxal phosphate-dependent aminotransferase n=1 Tax=Desulfovibrio sp. X2 TaxID=941449 RepID=UPI000358C6CC|nr:pyridoxal phosphate-dependent aminotransferase [Desulfovibrio sp. X2]EPR39991.1 aminotransferase class I and II [Desulfovibrio sp. X2]
MRLAERLSRIKPSATLAINAKTQELRAQGRQVVSLAVGEPDFPTPEHICAAAKEAIEQGFTRYTAVPGIPELREQAARYYERFYGVSAPKEAVILSNGGKQALYNLFLALLGPGDEVLLPAPYWVSYPDMVALADAACVPVPAGADKNYLVDVDDLESAATPRTRALILNSPSNPTGCCYTQAQLDAIAEWAVARGIFVISDEVYDRLVYAPAEPATLSPWWKKHPENFAIIGALSKTFCMTGWRVGWCLAHPDLVKAMVKIQGQSTSNVCSITQKAALAALTGPWDLVEEMKTAFARRRDLVLEAIATWPGAVCPKPDGAFYAFPDVSACYTAQIPDSTTLCTKLLEEAETALVPGAAFGDDRCIRISYALDDATLARAMERIGAVLRGK